MDRPHDAHSPETGLGPHPTAVRSLLAIRPGGVGDAVRAVPALRHLRETYPHALITVAAHAPGRELLEACPYVDRVIDLARPNEALVERFDVALSWADPTQPVAELVVDDVNARFRASWRRLGDGDRGSIHPSWPERLDDTTRMLRLSWLLGGSLDADASLGLWPSLADRNGAARLVAHAQRPVALVHAGAGSPQRRWPAEHWAHVVDLLHDSGLDTVLIGTRADRMITKQVLARATHAPASVVGRTSIGELAGLLERSTIFVGGDSGPAAMAGALGVRSVVVGPASAFEHVARQGQVDLVDTGACMTCGERACQHPSPPAAEVPLDRVLARVELAAATAMQRWRRSRLA
ncbi:MAG: glycosyl transferase, family 9 [Thermoleophilia bacterium]|nr:glycosyl transferase, family 9 [Thermoleophilia bacterium]